MSDCEEMLMGLAGWIRVVAAKFARRGVGVEREDYEQEAAFAILKKGTSDEPLAKTVAIRAMRKYRDRFGEERVTGRVGEEVRKPLTRQPFQQASSLSYRTTPTDVYWDEVREGLTEGEWDTLQEWVDSGDSTDEIGRKTETSGRTVRKRLERAVGKIRTRWGVEGEWSLPKRAIKRSVND